MNRWVIRAIVCLLLGAITTVAVAWWCAAFASLSFERMTVRLAEKTSNTGFIDGVWTGFGLRDASSVDVDKIEARLGGLSAGDRGDGVRDCILFARHEGSRSL